MLADGTGGARKRMKKLNFSRALSVSAPAPPFPAVTLLGTVANWQLGVSSRSVWKSSFVIPISTL